MLLVLIYLRAYVLHVLTCLSVYALVYLRSNELDVLTWSRAIVCSTVLPT